MYRDSKAPSISGEKRLAEIIQLTILLICNLLQRKVINSWLIQTIHLAPCPLFREQFEFNSN